MLGKSIVGRSAWTRPEPDVLYGLMRVETMSRIGRPSGNLHRAGIRDVPCAGVAWHLQDSR